MPPVLLLLLPLLLPLLVALPHISAHLLSSLSVSAAVSAATYTFQLAAWITDDASCKTCRARSACI